MQISEKGWRQTDTSNPGQRLKLVEFNTIRRKCANRTSGPVPDLLQILAKWTASEKCFIVNEILIENLMKIASDNPWQILCKYKKIVFQAAAADNRNHDKD